MQNNWGHYKAICVFEEHANEVAISLIDEVKNVE